MTSGDTDQGHHDIRRGATAYSGVVGAFGALAVPAIVLVFTAPTTKVANAATLETFATAFLVTGMFGCLLGAVAFAYIGAERDPIASLAAAIIYAAVPVSVSVCSILGAFEVLSVLYQPSAKTLFALIVAASGLFGVVYGSFAVIHCVALGPTDEWVRREWLARQPIRDRDEAKKAALVLAVTTVVPIALSVGLRLNDVHVRPTAVTIDVVVAVAVMLTLVSPLLAVLRTTPSLKPSDQKALRLTEAYAANLAVSGFVLLVLIALP